ncbi:hypothetical protein amrb99_13000 [Actinomadura sp. RB99]|uniref:hypothetical protein n=1 Tax=Actinomadura sp. RB99 TaxID=2691577 RepID=UPI0016874687|nr:hypothetical protein [Actinomadura sp. RB99]MBD2892390.1 hypothetical protein [Actinomadura sp. RB99]
MLAERRHQLPTKEDPAGSAWLFHLLADGTPQAYCDYASHYFEVPLDPANVRQVFEHRTLTTDLVRRINPDVDPADLTEVLDSVGHPGVEEPANSRRR